MRPALRGLQILFLATGVALIAAAATLLPVFVFNPFAGDDGQQGNSDARTATGFELRPNSLSPGSVAPQATPKPPAGDAEPAPVGTTPGRLVIPSIDVDAHVVTLSMDSNGVMQSPATPTDVGWYDFTAKPGEHSNAVFSGHVDYHDYGPAVFWNLRNLEDGDLIEVFGENGDVLRYEVVSSSLYPANDAPVSEIIGPSQRETLTIITCGGTFDPTVRQYSHRLVVRAERMETAGASVGP
jgi:LPXTG-site transpeptidase (sortase) family protein